MRTLDFDDFDACREALRGWSLEAVQLDRGAFRAELAQAMTGDTLVSEARFGRKLHQTGGPPPGLRTVGIPADRRQRIVWRGQEVGGEELMLFPDGAELDSVSQPGFHVVTFSIPEARLDAIAQDRYGCDYEDLASDEEVLRRPPEAVEALCREARRLLHEASAGLEEVLAHRLVETTGGSRRERPLALATNRSRAIQESLELIAASGREAVPVSDLCDASGVSRRTLEYAFRERFGVSPATYMLARRLRGTRRDLRSQSGPAAVTRAAQDWGFHHMSHFAALYKRQFGELPSETARG